MTTDGLTIADLAQFPRWVAWQVEQRPGGKPTKIPYSPHGPKAKADDPATWGNRALVQKRADLLPRPFKQGGVGLQLGALGDGTSIGGIDLDTCREQNGSLAPWAIKVVEMFATYSETSPSQTGAKVFFRYRSEHLVALRERGLLDAGDGHKRKPAWGRAWKAGSGEHPPAIEVHLGNRYFAVTDQALPNVPATLRLIGLDELERLFRMGEEFKGETGNSKAGNRSKKASDSSRSAIAFNKGAALRRTGKTFEEMCAALRADPETAEWCLEKGDANGARELRRIWDRAGEQNAAVDRVVAEFNSQFLVVNEAGRAVIYAPAEDPILHRRYYDRVGFDDLRQLYLNRRIEVGQNDKGNPITRGVADVWLQHPDRRQYIRGVIFDPSGRPVPDGTLNLWQGLAVKPRPGSWERLRVHIRDVVCGGDREQFDYVIRWMARMVQRPAEQGEVAIVMRGVEGTGKGTVARALKRILGQHALAVSNAKHLVGNFNAHLRDCVFLFADEAFFAGDRAHVGVLKALITEPHLTIEGKYQNAVQTPNFLHLMMASNEEWVIPASLEARRFMVLEVSDAHKDDHAWFAAIWAEMEDGGYEAMLHDLFQINLATFNVRRVPVTAGLQQQKKLSLGTDKAWWADVLHRGYVFRSRLGLEDDFGNWQEEVSTELLYASYTEFAERHRERNTLSRETFGRFMIGMGAKPKRLLNAPIGERIADVDGPFGTTRKAQPAIHPRPHGYALGPLSVARAAFVSQTGLVIDWQDSPLARAA